MSGPVTLHLGDCLEVLRGMTDNSVDTIITDPPFALFFMGREWDKAHPDPAVWREALRVCKPGATALIFGGGRTFHRLMCAVEDAGWALRTTLCWLYGQGFPKSLDIGKALDKAAGAEREVVGRYVVPAGGADGGRLMRSSGEHPGHYGQTAGPEGIPITAPATEAAKLWDGWGTALKPAWEPIILAMKPLDGTFAANALAHGVAGLHIDAARLGAPDPSSWKAQRSTGFPDGKLFPKDTAAGYANPNRPPSGRWPPNVALSHSPECILVGTRKVETATTVSHRSAGKTFGGNALKPPSPDKTYADAPDGTETVERWACVEGCAIRALEAQQSGASRFFYCAKVSLADRGKGNDHPTVKPLALMEWLCRLTETPTGGVVLDPFAGSGSTGVACVRIGRPFIGIERDAHYFEIAERRVREAIPAKLALFGGDGKVGAGLVG